MLYHQILSAVALSQSTMSSSKPTKPSVSFGGWDNLYKGWDHLEEWTNYSFAVLRYAILIQNLTKKQHMMNNSGTNMCTQFNFDYLCFDK